MASIYITEYRRMALDGISRIIPTGMEPSLATQKVTIGASSTQSAVFNKDTSFVMINADAACSVAFGDNPTADATKTRIPADGTLFFGVIPGQRVAVITNT